MGAVLVTGASRGIGRGIALELARAGHRVAVHYNGNREAAEATAAECRGEYEAAARRGSSARADGPIAEADETTSRPTAAADGTALPIAAVFQANIGVAEDRVRLVREVSERFGAIDGLVNNAGIAPRKRDDIVYAEEEIFDEVMRVNLYGPYFLTQLVARRWLEGAVSGRIVFVTSISATIVSTNRGEYCVSKAGLAMASQLFAARLAGEGILTFEVRPGITATDMTSGVKDKYDALIADGLVPQKRWGYPRDTGAVVRSIMDGHLDFAPGSVVYTDGGLHIPRL